MPMPRRNGFVVEPTKVLQDIQKCIVVSHRLDFEVSDPSEDGFESLNDAMVALRLPPSNPTDIELVTSHPLFQDAKQGYISLLNVFLPVYGDEDHPVQVHATPSHDHDPELTEALSILIALNHRRKQKAEEFFSTLKQFLEEYQKAIDELSSISAAPVLKGSYLHEKITELTSTVKRKYGQKVSELQKECINKRRRANLPDSAVNIFRKWFSLHHQNPYPSDMEKQRLAQDAGVAEAQVSNWFVNVRKRHWRSKS